MSQIRMIGCGSSTTIRVRTIPAMPSKTSTARQTLYVHHSSDGTKALKTVTDLPKLLLVWNPGKGSPIHDHANAHCIMKVLAGELTETVYHPPHSEGDETSPLQLKHQKRYQTDQVTYISDDIGLHRVYNPSPNQVAVSLHSMYWSNSTNLL